MQGRNLAPFSVQQEFLIWGSIMGGLSEIEMVHGSISAIRRCAFLAHPGFGSECSSRSLNSTETKQGDSVLYLDKKSVDVHYKKFLNNCISLLTLIS